MPGTSVPAGTYRALRLLRAVVVGTILVVAVLALATVLGLVIRARSGQMRDVAAPDPSVPGPSEQAHADPSASTRADIRTDGRADVVAATDHGDRVGAGPRGSAAQLDRALMDELGIPASTEVTLLQFSSSFCQPCRATRLVLGDVAATMPGVEHIEVDVERHLDLVRRFDIRRTPTVFVLDSSGRVRKRASGQPRRVDVVAAVTAAGATVPRQ